MNIKFSKNQDVTVIELEGRLSYEKVKSLEIQKDLLSKGKIVFALNKISFVGSSGIQLLFQVLADMQMINPNLRVTGVRVEFEKLVQFSKISHLTLDSNFEDSMTKVLEIDKSILG